MGTVREMWKIVVGEQLISSPALTRRLDHFSWNRVFYAFLYGLQANGGPESWRPPIWR
jgi:hypothetical protein